MKNPLADALRQASDGGQTLSDSGSYDTRGVEPGVTANDETVDVLPLDELELLEATGALVVDGGGLPLQATEPTDAAHLPDCGDAAMISHRLEQPPRLSRFAPLICVVAALAAAGGWGLYSRLESHTLQSGIGAAPAVETAGTGQSASDPSLAAERFPFLAGAPTEVAGAPE